MVLGSSPRGGAKFKDEQMWIVEVEMGEGETSTPVYGPFYFKEQLFEFVRGVMLRNGSNQAHVDTEVERITRDLDTEVYFWIYWTIDACNKEIVIQRLDHPKTCRW